MNTKHLFTSSEKGSASVPARIWPSSEGSASVPARMVCRLMALLLLLPLTVSRPALGQTANSDSHASFSQLIDNKSVSRASSNEYPDNMSMVIRLLALDGTPVDTCEVSAFIEGECRGTTRAISGLYFLLISGEGSGQQVEIVTTLKGRTVTLDRSITYTSDLNIGTPWEPYVIHLDRFVADVNADGAVDVADIATVIAVMAGSSDNVSPEAADVNGDGTVDVADIATIINILATTTRGSGSETVFETEAPTVGQAVQENWADSVETYRQQVRMGDATAYLSLAHCYHKGLGVKHDFMNMILMVGMAKFYGVSNALDEFTSKLNADDPDYIQIRAFDDLEHRRYDEARQKAALLASMGDPAAELILGSLAMDQNDKEEADRLFRQAAEKGSRLARIALYKYESGSEGLSDIADECPLLYNELARDCFKSDISPREDKQAAYYYQKAYDALCLDPTGARWLLGYYQYMSRENGLGADPAIISSLQQMVQKYEERCR